MTGADFDLDALARLVNPALHWVRYSNTSEAGVNDAKMLIQQVPALVDALTAARADVRRYQTERNWLLAGLDEAGRGNFHMLAQTREEAIAELGEDRYRELVRAAIAATRPEMARNHWAVAAIAAANADMPSAVPGVAS